MRDWKKSNSNLLLANKSLADHSLSMEKGISDLKKELKSIDDERKLFVNQYGKYLIAYFDLKNEYIKFLNDTYNLRGELDKLNCKIMTIPNILKEKINVNIDR